jgi:arginine deiminase
MDENAYFRISAAYGGKGWQPRSRPLREEVESAWGSFGMDSEWAPLKSVVLHRPGPEIEVSADPQSVQFEEPVDYDLARTQHDAIAQAYRDVGVSVHYLAPKDQVPPNQMFMADLMFMTPEGMILARPASDVRAGEERQAARKLAELGIPIVRSISGIGTFEGADALWLDSTTVILGHGLRTNTVGVTQITNVLAEMDVSVIPVDLPFGTMHLMGMLRIADRDLATVYPRQLAVSGVEALRERGYEVAFLPDEHEAHHRSAHNYVTIGPREIIMSANCPVTQAFYESHGIICHTVDVSELRKAAGAIGCLSGILQREMIG